MQCTVLIRAIRISVRVEATTADARFFRKIDFASKDAAKLVATALMLKLASSHAPTPTVDGLVFEFGEGENGGHEMAAFMVELVGAVVSV